MIVDELRELLVTVTGRGDLRNIDRDTPLLHDPVALGSLGGVRLLRAVTERYGVDVAAEDLNLDALSSLGALAAFIADRAEPGSTHDFRDIAFGGDHRVETERSGDIDAAGMRKLEAFSAKKLYLVDATYGDSPILGDVNALEAAARLAVADARGHVMTGNHVVFPNGAITVVMILAESHLSIHTWPEERLIAIDLFSCGAIDGRMVIERLTSAAGLGNPVVREIDRG